MSEGVFVRERERMCACVCAHVCVCMGGGGGGSCKGVLLHICIAAQSFSVCVEKRLGGRVLPKLILSGPLGLTRPMYNCMPCLDVTAL